MEPLQQNAPANRNGILVFSHGGPICLPEGFPELPMNVYSRLGFSLIKLKNKDRKEFRTLTAATEDQYRSVLAALLNIRPDEVVLPSSEPDENCHVYNGACLGTQNCPSTKPFSNAVVDPGRGFIGCVCDLLAGS